MFCSLLMFHLLDAGSAESYQSFFIAENEIRLTVQVGMIARTWLPAVEKLPFRFGNEGSLCAVRRWDPIPLFSLEPILFQPFS